VTPQQGRQKGGPPQLPKCRQPGCTGRIEDGYCNVCGSPAGAPPAAPGGHPPAVPGQPAGPAAHRTGDRLPGS
jgi:serine/threonine-protein kinase PknG